MRRGLLGLVAASALAACGPSKPVWGVESLPQVSRLTSGGAQRYNEPFIPVPSSPDSPLEKALRDAAARAGVAMPIIDPRLSKACAELAKVTPEEGVVGYSMVEFALQSNGIIEPSPHLLIVWARLNGPLGIVQQLEPHLAPILSKGITNIGFGAAKRMTDGTGALVLAFQRSQLHTRPIPRRVPVGQTFEVVMMTEGRQPIVYFAPPSGDVEEIIPQLTGTYEFTASMKCGTPGRSMVEVDVGRVDGPTTLARFPVWCGQHPPSTFAVKHDLSSSVTDNRKAERDLIDSFNEARRAAGKPPLQVDLELSRLAREHAAEMRRFDHVSEILPSSNLYRLTKELGHGIRIGGAVAKAYSVAEVHDGLIDAPSTRSALLGGKPSHIGLGVVLGEDVGGRREIYVAISLTAPQ